MNLRQISLLQIDSFLAVAKYLNFTEAAKSLYIAQPSLSKQIAVLEREIGVQLFIRTKRSVRLTPEGSVLYAELKDIGETISQAFEKAKKCPEEEHILIVGVLEAMKTDSFLPERIEKFKKTHPNVTVVYERHSFKILREKLLSGAIDLIFTLSFEINDSLGVLCEDIRVLQTDIIIGKSHPLSNRDHLTIADLKDEKFISISREESPKGYDAVVTLCEKHGFTPNIVKQLPNIDSLILCLEAGLGVFLMDSNVQLNHEDRFKRYPIDDDFMAIVAAWKKDNLNPAISMFIGENHIT